MSRSPVFTSMALTAALGACAGTPVKDDSPVSVDAARAFFDRFLALSNAHDVAMAELFADEARLRTLHHAPEGDRSLEIGGAQFKALYRQAPQAERTGERETFTEVVVTTSRAGAHVKAHLYSQLNCTHDDDFAMDIAADGSGALRIVDIYQQSWSASQCGLGEGKSPAQRFAEVADATTPTLPVSVATDIRLDTLTAQGNELVYSYTLVNGTAADLDIARLTRDVRAAMVSSCCELLPHLVLALRDGGRVTTVYVGRAREPLLRFTIQASDCPVPGAP